MRYKRFAVVFTAVALASSLAGMPSHAEPTAAIWLPAMFAAPAQCAAQPVVASGLRAPVKLIFTQQGNLLVAEAGSGPNTGRLSFVDPANGHRRTRRANQRTLYHGDFHRPNRQSVCARDRGRGE